MNRTFAVAVSLSMPTLISAALFLSGCGSSGSSGSTSTPPPTYPTLTGNWALTATSQVTKLNYQMGAYVTNANGSVSGIIHLLNSGCFTPTQDIPITGKVSSSEWFPPRVLQFRAKSLPLAAQSRMRRYPLANTPSRAVAETEMRERSPGILPPLTAAPIAAASCRFLEFRLARPSLHCRAGPMLTVSIMYPVRQRSAGRPASRPARSQAARSLARTWR